MSIKISLHPYFLGEQTTGKTLQVNGSTVGQCLDDLVKQSPDIERRIFEENGKLQWSVFVFVNGGSSLPDHLAKEVKDGDQIEVIPLIRTSAGG